jgi:hypothetical protein
VILRGLTVFLRFRLGTERLAAQTAATLLAIEAELVNSGVRVLELDRSQVGNVAAAIANARAFAAEVLSILKPAAVGEAA